MEVKRNTIDFILEQLEAKREFVIELPSSQAKSFKQKLSTAKHYSKGARKEKLKMTVIWEDLGVTAIHCILGGGVEVEYYAINEVEQL